MSDRSMPYVVLPASKHTPFDSYTARPQSRFLVFFSPLYELPSNIYLSFFFFLSWRKNMILTWLISTTKPTFSFTPALSTMQVPHQQGQQQQHPMGMMMMSPQGYAMPVTCVRLTRLCDACLVLPRITRLCDACHVLLLHSIPCTHCNRCIPLHPVCNPSLDSTPCILIAVV